MAPKTLLPGAAVVLLLLLLLLHPLQADPVHGEAIAARTASPAEHQAEPHPTSVSVHLLDAFTRRPRQIRFKSSYLELPAVLRGLVGIRGLGHLSYFVQVDVPVTPPASTALDRLPAGTKTYFPPYVSLLGTAATDETTTEGPQHPSVASKSLSSSQAVEKQTGFGGLAVIPIKNISDITDNKLDTLLSTSTVSTTLGTDGGPSATPSYLFHSTSSNPTTSATQLQNVSYSTSGISWLPQSFNFLRSSSLGVSTSSPRTIKVTSTSPKITIPTPTTTTTAPPTTTAKITTTLSAATPLSSSSSSSFLSSYFFSVFSTTTPLPLIRHTSNSHKTASSTRISTSASDNPSLLRIHTTTPRYSYPSPTPPSSLSTTQTPSSLSSYHLSAKYSPPIKSNSTASSYPLIKKHSSALKSFTLPSTSSPSSKSFAFPSTPLYSSFNSHAPSSKSSSTAIQSATPSSIIIPSKHTVKYATFTPTSSVVKSVKVLTSSSTSSSLRASRPLRTTLFPKVIHSDSLSKAALGTNPGSRPSRRPSRYPPKHLVSSASTTARPSSTQHSRRPTTRPAKSPSRSPRLLSFKNNLFSKTPRPSTSQPSSSISTISQMRALPSRSSEPSFKHTAASLSSSSSPPKLRPTTSETNPKTFSSTSVQVLQFPQGWKRERVEGNVNSKVGDRLRDKDEEGVGVEVGGIGEVEKRSGNGGGKGGRGNKFGGKGGGIGGGTGGERSTEGKAGKKTLGAIIRDRKLLLGRVKDGSKGEGSIDRVSRQDKLQVKSKSGRENRVVADRRGFALPTLRTTPKPDGRTRPSDGHTNDDAAVSERGSTDHTTLRSIPRTAFTCPHTPKEGYFADQETGCQVFHVCWHRRRATFLCPAGTLFNQRVQVCDWWYNVDCDTTPSGDTNTSVKDT